MSHNPAIDDHQAWLGYLQPDGLVVSAAALVDAQAILNRGEFIALQEKFTPFVGHVAPKFGEDKPLPAITDLPAFLCGFLDWPDDCLAADIPESLKLALAEGETLAPDFTFREPKPADPARPWLLLIQQLPPGTDFDARTSADARSWAASPAQRFERLLRGVEVPIGLLSNATHLRLIYAPRGENSGSLTFPVAAMAEIAGRPILAALHMLLGRYRLLAAPRESRLAGLLQRSRDYQSSVSTALARQVLDALYELLRGFEHAHAQTGATLLREVLEKNPDDIYAGLLSVLMRLVFLLYAEDRGLLPASELYARGYSIHGLFERLREDAEKYPDTLDLRYGAWAQLCVLFRLIHGGCKHPRMAMPPRRGHLFDPDRYPFLEGRPTQSAAINQQLPLVSDGTLHRVLSRLLILDGERLSYRTLDVEQIGSVYETMMGFRMEIARGPSIALRPAKSHGAPVAIPLDQLLAEKPAERAKWLRERTDLKIEGPAATRLRDAASLEDLLAALQNRLAKNATPALVAPGGLLLQPSDERRRSGSHYTPRALTGPIVRKALAPILAKLCGGDVHWTKWDAPVPQMPAIPKPEEILALKICDPAIGSGAFVVETCRQLAEALVAAWRVHGGTPPIPPDEDELLLARRLVAQRCLYGVDRNPMAVDLAKLSLWLATLARDHPFTFLDHAIRPGDSLVGLSRAQLLRFHWQPQAQLFAGSKELITAIESATRERRDILAMTADDPYSVELKRAKLANADSALDSIRRAGDLCLAAFFMEEKDRARVNRRDDHLQRLLAARSGDVAEMQRIVQILRELRSGPHPITPFHWEIEYPEVFDRENPGFDGFVGNPPFLGGLRVSNMLGMQFFGYLIEAYPGAGHLCDLVAYFFRRVFALLRDRGTFGLVATNSIAQGDTRTGGLAWICSHGGHIYHAHRRQRWPGEAAVMVSFIHVSKGEPGEPVILDEKVVPRITAYLFTSGGNADPSRLAGMNDLFSQGTNIRSSGFLIGDDDEATTTDEMRSLIAASPASESRIFPYLGGEEINSSPNQLPRRFVIYLSDLREESQLQAWPELTEIVRKKVKPERDALGDNPNNIPLKRRWWAYHADRLSFYADLKRVLVMSQVSGHLAFTFQPTNRVFGNTLNMFRIEKDEGFAVLQSRVHESWARFFASTMKDDMRYTPSDCFETFPFPEGWASDGELEAAGREYYEARAALMARTGQGLTATYNRFHDPDFQNDPDIRKLHELHARMDAAVLRAYRWPDLLDRCTCEFLLEYEDDEDESETDGKPRRRKKPYRYRWPDLVRDEVLARLLALNATRAEQERLTGATAEAGKAKGKRPKKSATAPAQTDLIPPPQRDLFV